MWDPTEEADALMCNCSKTKYVHRAPDGSTRTVSTLAEAQALVRRLGGTYTAR